MNRLILPTLILTALATTATAETRDLRGFDSVRAEGRFRVEVTVGPEYRVDVSGPDAARIATRVEGDTLEIKPLHRPWFGGEPRFDATVQVTLPELDGIAAARGARVQAVAGGDCHEFDAASAMGGVLEVRDLRCTSIDAAAAMGATLTLAGSCDQLDISAAMGAVVEADDLHCATVDATAAMGADVAAYASNTYDASASMGGNIAISGEARDGDRSSVMGGSITRRN